MALVAAVLRLHGEWPVRHGADRCRCRPRGGGRAERRRAVFRLGGAVGLVAVSLVAAQLYLSQSRVVAWIEQSTQQNLAVSLMRQPEFRHLQ